MYETNDLRARWRHPVVLRTGTSQSFGGEALVPGREYAPDHPAVLARPTWWMLAPSVRRAAEAQTDLAARARRRPEPMRETPAEPEPSEPDDEHGA